MNYTLITGADNQVVQVQITYGVVPSKHQWVMRKRTIIAEMMLTSAITQKYHEQHKYL